MQSKPPAKPVFGQKPPERCALCLYPFANKTRYKIDGEGRAVCKASYACKLREQFLINTGGKRADT